MLIFVQIWFIIEAEERLPLDMKYSYPTLGYQKFLHGLRLQEVTPWNSSNNVETIAGCRTVPAFPRDSVQDGEMGWTSCTHLLKGKGHLVRQWYFLVPIDSYACQRDSSLVLGLTEYVRNSDSKIRWPLPFNIVWRFLWCHFLDPSPCRYFW